MRKDISPVPNQEQMIQSTPGSITSFAWLEWFRQLRDFVNGFNIFRNYGSFANTTNHNLAAINTPTVISFDQQPLVDSISLLDTSKIVVPGDGLYRFVFSTQLTSTSASTKNAWFWPRINGVDISESTIKYSVQGSSTTVVVTRSGIFQMSRGDYLEAWWAADSINVQLTAFAPTAFAPGTPSVLLEIFQIA